MSHQENRVFYRYTQFLYGNPFDWCFYLITTVVRFLLRIYAQVKFVLKNSMESHRVSLGDPVVTKKQKERLDYEKVISLIRSSFFYAGNLRYCGHHHV
jgi:hypothetical protein